MSDLKRDEEKAREEKPDEGMEVIDEATSLDDEDLEDVSGGGCSGGSGCCDGLEK